MPHVRLRTTCAAALIFAIGATFSRHALADRTHEAVVAEELFEEGRKLVRDGRVAEGCEKLAASQRTDPSAGTLINLADCYEKLGRTASAWASFKEAARAAVARNRSDWEKMATRRAQALEPKLIRLRIDVVGDLKDLVVLRDGQEVQRSAWGVPVAVDPGHHVIEAKAEGREPFRAEIDLSAEGHTERVEVPVLAQGKAVAVPLTPVGPKAQSPAPEDVTGRTQRTLGIVAGGVGVLGLGFGAFMGVSAKGKLDDTKAACPSYPIDCPTSVDGDHDTARSYALMSNVGFIAGAVLVATGAVLYFTAPRGASSVRATSSGLRLEF